YSRTQTAIPGDPGDRSSARDRGGRRDGPARGRCRLDHWLWLRAFHRRHIELYRRHGRRRFRRAMRAAPAKIRGAIRAAKAPLGVGGNGRKFLWTIRRADQPRRMILPERHCACPIAPGNRTKMFPNGPCAELRSAGAIGRSAVPTPAAQTGCLPEYSLVTRSSDGQMLFLANMLSKMTHDTPLGSRIAEVHNGSPLFTGDAGGSEDNVRRWIIENDWLEAIVALPLNMFYNTGIATYVWVLTNRKP